MEEEEEEEEKERNRRKRRRRKRRRKKRRWNTVTGSTYNIKNHKESKIKQYTIFQCHNSTLTPSSQYDAGVSVTYGA